MNKLTGGFFSFVTHEHQAYTDASANSLLYKNIHSDTLAAEEVYCHQRLNTSK